MSGRCISELCQTVYASLVSDLKQPLQVQSFDQVFEKMNKALLVSCQKGLPVRVVRSYKVNLSCHRPHFAMQEVGLFLPRERTDLW